MLYVYNDWNKTCVSLISKKQWKNNVADSLKRGRSTVIYKKKKEEKIFPLKSDRSIIYKKRSNGQWRYYSDRSINFLRKRTSLFSALSSSFLLLFSFFFFSFFCGYKKFTKTFRNGNRLEKKKMSTKYFYGCMYICILKFSSR